MAASIKELGARSSQLSNPDAPSFFDLAAELRNKVYSYLFVHTDPVCVRVTRDLNSKNTEMRFRLTRGYGVPVAAFSTCRSLGKEAASVFYSINTFMMVRDFNEGLYNCACNLDAFPAFLDNLGSQAELIRKVVLDVDSICEWDCHVSYRNWMPVFEPTGSVTEITPVLRSIWNREANIDVSFEQKYETNSGIRSNYSTERFPCNPSAMTKVVRMLLDGQLDLQTYGPLVGAVAIKRDGTGGMVSWATIFHDYDDSGWSRYQPTPDSVVSFTAGPEGNSCHLLEPKEQRTLLGLPTLVRNQIFHESISVKGRVCIDLDVDTHFATGLLSVNKQLRRGFWPLFIVKNDFTVKMTANNKRSHFSDFSALRRLLRKKFTFHNLEDLDWTLEDCQDLRVVLDFKLPSPASFEELRISILPLVMETTSTSGDKEVIVRLRTPSTDGRDTITTESSITLLKLRTNVVKVLNDIVFQGQTKWAPEIWINGLGEVVETHTLGTNKDEHPAIASLVEHDGGSLWTLTRLHRKDWRYRGYQHRSQCVFADTDQFFPFQHSVAETLNYLLWVLETPKRRDV